MLLNDRIWVGQADDTQCCLLLNQANRHGLIAGASGTGKTVTLKVLAEGFSKAGVPVFLADVKGDVAGMAQAGEDTEGIRARIERFGLEGFTLEGCPARLWDMVEGVGAPIRITVSDMGPELLSRLLGLTDVQRGVLDVVFRIADDKQLLLIDLKDLRAMINYVAEHASEFTLTYGKVSSQSAGAILRSLISVENEGGNLFFGEPNLDLRDWFTCDLNGRGYVNILNASKIITSPQLYSMFLLWMLSKLFEILPECGDVEKPKFVFFFDEAHLLFNDMPKELLNKIIQVVKLIRSKGVGVYFITQSPNDIPDEVLAQLSNRIQHGLRAYTPAEQKNVRAAAAAFRDNPDLDEATAILELGTGEALVSMLDEEGRPSIVQAAKILPPQCLMAAPSEDTIKRVLEDQSFLQAKYGTAIDRQSAYEELVSAAGAQDAQDAGADAATETQNAAAEPAPLSAAEQAKEIEKAKKEAAAETKRIMREEEAARKKAEREAATAKRQRDKAINTIGEAVAETAAATVLGGVLGKTSAKKLARGLFGVLKP